ncbi:unnamed protein product [Linum tenue]|uniref:Uncharacterized protein n=1 Tax=Linum tenue TaxID=586396 RepID=A0AAV0MKH2_9ROSI|nr:unnamed protein product [Linum tenue]
MCFIHIRLTRLWLSLSMRFTSITLTHNRL